MPSIYKETNSGKKFRGEIVKTVLLLKNAKPTKYVTCKKMKWLKASNKQRSLQQIAFIWDIKIEGTLW